MSKGKIKSIPNAKPASKEQIIAEIQNALKKAYEQDVQSVQISMHIKGGGYYTFECFTR